MLSETVIDLSIVCDQSASVREPSPDLCQYRTMVSVAVSMYVVTADLLRSSLTYGLVKSSLVFDGEIHTARQNDEIEVRDDALFTAPVSRLPLNVFGIIAVTL